MNLLDSLCGVWSYTSHQRALTDRVKRRTVQRSLFETLEPVGGCSGSGPGPHRYYSTDDQRGAAETG